MKKEFINCPSCFEEEEMYGFDWISNSDGFYCIFAAVNKYGHMYATVKEKNALVINFPSADVYMKCHATIYNNEYEDDEIQMAGLTAEKASMVDAPRIEECFLNLECEYVWEKELTPDSHHVVMCVKVVNVVMDEEYYNEQKKGRYGETGYLYNIHSPRNPETGEEENTYVGIIKKHATYDELSDKYE